MTMTKLIKIKYQLIYLTIFLCIYIILCYNSIFNYKVITVIFFIID